MRKEQKTAKLFLLTALMIGVFIYANELLRKDLTVDIFGYTILLSIFVYPITFYIANLITRGYEVADTIKAVLLAVLVQLIIYWVGYRGGDFGVIISIIVAFVIAQATNLYVVEDLIKRETTKYADWFMLYVLIFILDNIVYIAMVSNYTAISILSTPILLSIIFKCIIAAFLGFKEVIVLTRK